MHIYSSCCSPESYVVTGGIDDDVKVWAWRNEQLELRHRLDGHALGVVSVDTSSEAKCKNMQANDVIFFLIYPELIL